jgi:hypothetical protein
MNVTLETSPEQEQRGRAIWDRLVEQCRNGPLPFVKVDPKNPPAIISLWDVADSGNESDDLARGCFYAELLVHRAKKVARSRQPKHRSVSNNFWGARGNCHEGQCGYHRTSVFRSDRNFGACGVFELN